MMLTQQQHQQKQMPDFQVIVHGAQEKQQNHLMLAMVSMLIEPKCKMFFH